MLYELFITLGSNGTAVMNPFIHWFLTMALCFGSSTVDFIITVDSLGKDAAEILEPVNV